MRLSITRFIFSLSVIKRISTPLLNADISASLTFISVKLYTQQSIEYSVSLIYVHNKESNLTFELAVSPIATVLSILLLKKTFIFFQQIMEN